MIVIKKLLFNIENIYFFGYIGSIELYECVRLYRRIGDPSWRLFRTLHLIVVTIPEKNIPTLGQKPLEHVPADVVIVDTGNYYRSRAG